MSKLIIVHGNCMDGMGALWAAHILLGGVEGEYHFGFYGQPAPDVAGKEVMIFDFSYPRETLLAMKSQALSLVVFDHHASAQSDLAGLDFCYFDQSKSGAVLAWEYLYRYAYNKDCPNIPKVLEYIQDRDLWKWELPFSREFNEWLRHTVCLKGDPETALAVLTKTNNCIEWHAEATLEQFNKRVAEGAFLLTEKQKAIDAVVARHFFVTISLADVPLGDVVQEYKVPVVFCPHTIASEVGHALAELSEHKVGLSIENPHEERFGLSFRGVGNNLAKRMATRYGGGGHDQAAGASLNSWQLAALISTMTPRKVTP